MTPPSTPADPAMRAREDWIPARLAEDPPALRHQLDALCRMLADDASAHGFRLAAPCEQRIAIDGLAVLMPAGAAALLSEYRILVREPDMRLPEQPPVWFVVTAAAVAPLGPVAR